MIRKDHEGNILRLGEYQEADGTYQYRWIDENGTARISRAEDLDALRKEIALIHQYLDQGIPTGSMRMTLDQLYRLWLSEKKNLRTRTVQRYMGMYENAISGVLGNQEIRVLRKADVRRYCEDLTDRKGLKESTVRNYFRLLYQILEFGVREGYLPVNPAKRAWRSSKYSANSTQPCHRKALTVREQKMVLEILEQTPALRRWRPVISFMLFTGLRIGELEALRWSDVDEDRGFLYVSHTMGRKYAGDGPPEPKTGKPRRHQERRHHFRKCLSRPKTAAGERQIPLVEKAKQALAEERLHQKNLGIVCRETIDGCRDFVFLTDEGKLISDSLMNAVIQKLCAHVRMKHPEAFKGMERVTCHTFRHTFATRMSEAGVQMKVIQEVMGHADIGMTMNVYAEATAETLNQEILVLEGSSGVSPAGEAMA